MSGQIRYSDEAKIDAVAQVTERGYGGGKVWAPDNDKTCRGTLLLREDTLTMSGCVLGGSMFRGSVFSRIK